MTKAKKQSRHRERAVLLGLAQAERTKIEDAIEALEDPDLDDAEAIERASFVRDQHHGPLAKVAPWFCFVRAIQEQTVRMARAKRKAGPRTEPPAGIGSPDVVVTRRVIEAYGEAGFVTYAGRLSRSKVRAAVVAWRDRTGKPWPLIHAALCDVLPNVPTAKSLATQWSRETKGTPLSRRK